MREEIAANAVGFALCELEVGKRVRFWNLRMGKKTDCNRRICYRGMWYLFPLAVLVRFNGVIFAEKNLVIGIVVPDHRNVAVAYGFQGKIYAPGIGSGGFCGGGFGRAVIFDCGLGWYRTTKHDLIDTIDRPRGWVQY